MIGAVRAINSRFVGWCTYANSQ